jgi:hypothetical protein
VKEVLHLLRLGNSRFADFWAGLPIISTVRVIVVGNARSLPTISPAIIAPHATSE